MTKSFVTRLFFITAFFCIFLPFQTGAAEVSTGLLEATADAKLKTLIGCINSNNNDISLCLDNLKDYLITEIKLVRAAPDTPKFKERLNKMIIYLKESTDVFFSKAQKTRSLTYYKKAADCASILTSLSNEYKDYARMASEFQLVKRGIDETVLLSQLYKKMEDSQYPTSAFQNAFNLLVERTLKEYDYLESGFQKQLTTLGNDLVTKYMSHMRSIVSDLESYNEPQFGSIHDEFVVYETAIKIPNVDGHQDESLLLRKNVGLIIAKYIGRMKELTGDASNQFLHDDKNTQATESLSLQTYLLLVASKAVKSNENLFLEVPSIPVEVLNDAQNLTQFLKFANQANSAAVAKNYMGAVSLWVNALSINSIDNQLVKKAEADQSNAIQAAVKQAVDNAKETANKKRFSEALKELDNAYSSLSLNKEQQHEISTLIDDIHLEGQEYVLDFANRLKSNGKYMESLRTIDLAISLGMNTKLQTFYEKLKRNFDYSQIQSLDDAKYFLNCSSDELTHFMTFPKEAGLDTYCAYLISFHNQLDKNSYIGYLGDSTEYPLYVTINNPVFEEAVLINKAFYCVFRINGTKTLVNYFNNGKVVYPSLEVIFLN